MFPATVVTTNCAWSTAAFAMTLLEASILAVTSTWMGREQRKARQEINLLQYGGEEGNCSAGNTMVVVIQTRSHAVCNMLATSLSVLPGLFYAKLGLMFPSRWPDRNLTDSIFGKSSSRAFV